jgi:pilus assembly protein CpaC
MRRSVCLAVPLTLGVLYAPLAAWAQERMTASAAPDAGTMPRPPAATGQDRALPLPLSGRTGLRPAVPPAVSVAVPAIPAVQAPRLPTPIALVLEAGGGRLLQLPAPAITIMAADPRIARVQPASPTSIFLMAVAPGRTTVIATAEDGAPVAEYDILVQPGRGAVAVQVPGTEQRAPSAPPLSASAVQSLIRRLVRGGEGVEVAAAGSNGLLLSGLVPGAAEAQRAEAIARAYAGEAREVINSLSLLSSIQVNVRVRVAEISRQVTRELGFNWQALASDGANWLIGLRTGGAGAVLGALRGAVATTSVAPGRYGVSFSSSRFDINAVIDALAADHLITVLAEPNLTAQSGEVASFLAGGEFPVPVAASGTSNAISIDFKQFGVSLAFVPTVLGPDRLNLRVRPEVSELTENGAVTVPLATGTVTIPALSVRRAETTVELGSGQSFAIAGLLQRSSTLVNSGVSGLGDVPVLGALFRSDRFRRNETELVIIVTPYLVRPVSDPQALGAPTDGLRPATDLDRILHRRQIARGAPQPQLRRGLDAGFILE